jgi:hypothetical protein
MDRPLRPVTSVDESAPAPAPETKKRRYTIHVRCSNCEWSGPIKIPCGVAVAIDEEIVGTLSKCPHCECARLVRIAKPVQPPAAPERTTTDELMEELRRRFPYPPRVIEEPLTYPPVEAPPAITSPSIIPWVTPTPCTPMPPYRVTWCSTPESVPNPLTYTWSYGNVYAQEAHG